MGKDSGSDEFKTATASVFRALSRLRDIEVDYSASARAGEQQTGEDRATLPLPAPRLSPNEVGVVRGSSDIKALRLRYHDFKLHKKLAPEDGEARTALEAMEQARCEALGARLMAGVERNISDLYETRLERYGYDRAGGREEIPLAEALHVLTWLSLGGREAGPGMKRVRDLWQPWVSEKLEGESLEVLSGYAHDQSGFARMAKKLLGRMELKAGGEEESEARDKQDSLDQETAGDNGDSQSMEAVAGEPSLEDESDQAEAPAPDQSSVEVSEGETEGEAQDGAVPGAPDFERPEGFIPGPEGLYHVYTTKFDEVINANRLAEPEELRALRQTLDGQLAHVQGIVSKLANKLQRRLMAKQQRSWLFDLEEGVLDTSKLSRVIANPNVSLTYKMEAETRFRDTVVTLLIDNSGSMRGRPITIAAICTDILARTLERAGVKVEILGFTTSEWKGGKSRQLWTENGRPARPGRLNDLRHIIYKSADEPWRRTRKNLGLMLKEGILKENIDGEALAWAYNRLARRQEQRKILMVISDGAPVDDSTLSVNPSNILERDLKSIIKWIETKSKVEMTAIGIGHDVTRYYSKSITITDAEALAEALIYQLERLLDESGARSQRRR